MDAFCDIDQYQARYGEVDDPALLSEALMDASRIIASRLDNSGIDWQDPDEDYAERLMQVTRDMAHRAFSVDTAETSIPFGATQFTTSADGFSEQVGFQGGTGQGYGELYMTKAERLLLGIGRQRIGSIPPVMKGVCHARH